MAHNNKEIEVKFPLKNQQAVAAFLNQHAQQIASDKSQKDTYFTPPHKDFLAVDYPYEWLRLRKTEKDTILNYKHFYPENVKTIDYCDEFETLVDHTVIHNIFNQLQFKELVTVEKTRSTWMFKDVEIAIDEVNELGSFIELEITTHFDDLKEAKNYLYALVQEIGADIGEEDYRGYPFLLLEKKGHQFK